MSKIKIIDGVEYILKTDVDEIVSSRISRYAEKTRQLETQVEQYQSQIDDSKQAVGLVDKLNSQIDQLQSQLDTARSQYERHSTIGSFGITDPTIRDAVEWSFEREMKGRAKKDQQTLSEWLDSIKTDPTTAPSVLRPFFNPPVNETKQENPAVVEHPVPAPVQQQTSPVQPVNNPPSSNAGVQNVQQVSTGNILSRAHDRAFFDQNRQAIKEAFYSQRNKRG